MTRRRIAALGATTALVLAGCGYGVDRAVNHVDNDHAAQARLAEITRETCMNQGATYVMWEGAGSARECVGLTDGSFAFVKHNPAMALVLAKIKAEDKLVRQQVKAGARYVTIAYLLPISATGGVEPVKTVIEQLEGAYTAQYYANRNNVEEGTRPLVQLLVASGPFHYDTSGEIKPSDDVGQNVDTSIGAITNQICTSSPHLVLFAGRGRELAELLTDLQTRSCQTKPIEIVSGSDVINMPPVAISRNVSIGLGNVTVYYSGEANPGEWMRGSGSIFNAGKQGFDQFQQAFNSHFPGVVITDGNAMIGYDATYTGISAIRLAGATKESPGTVASKLSLLQGADQVLGATGPISLSANYLQNKMAGNPVDKAVPILQWTPGGIKFVRLEYPLGAG